MVPIMPLIGFTKQQTHMLIRPHLIWNRGVNAACRPAEPHHLAPSAAALGFRVDLHLACAILAPSTRPETYGTYSGWFGICTACSSCPSWSRIFAACVLFSLPSPFSATLRQVPTGWSVPHMWHASQIRPAQVPCGMSSWTSCMLYVLDPVYAGWGGAIHEARLTSLIWTMGPDDFDILDLEDLTSPVLSIEFLETSSVPSQLAKDLSSLLLEGEERVML